MLYKDLHKCLLILMEKKALSYVAKPLGAYQGSGWYIIPGQVVGRVADQLLAGHMDYSRHIVWIILHIV